MSTKHPKSTSLDNAQRMKGLRDYVEDGTDTSIKIHQDDVTKEWILYIGTKVWFYADTFEEVIDRAITNYRRPGV